MQTCGIFLQGKVFSLGYRSRTQIPDQSSNLQNTHSAPSPNLGWLDKTLVEPLNVWVWFWETNDWYF